MMKYLNMKSLVVAAVFAIIGSQAAVNSMTVEQKELKEPTHATVVRDGKATIIPIGDIDKLNPDSVLKMEVYGDSIVVQMKTAKEMKAKKKVAKKAKKAK